MYLRVHTKQYVVSTAGCVCLNIAGFSRAAVFGDLPKFGGIVGIVPREQVLSVVPVLNRDITSHNSSTDQIATYDTHSHDGQSRDCKCRFRSRVDSGL